MVKSAFFKVMRVGKGTVFVVGLAMILADASLPPARAGRWHTTQPPKKFSKKYVYVHPLW